MFGLIRSGWDAMDINVQQSNLVEFQTLKPGLFPGFFHRDSLHIIIAIRMTAGLQPSSQLLVVSQQDPLARAIENQRRPRHVTDDQEPLETIMVVFYKTLEPVNH
jgi:hypothetical protein